MQIQVNTSSGIEHRDALERWAGAELRHCLTRFVDDVTRVEVHLSDESPEQAKGGGKRCVMEARLAHYAPVAVTHDAPGVNEAFHGAADKLKRLLESTLGRLHNRRDRSSIRNADGDA